MVSKVKAAINLKNIFKLLCFINTDGCEFGNEGTKNLAKGEWILLN
jgi:hypothetical protein